MAQEIAFAAPRTEELTKVATGIAGAGITGVVEGTVVYFAKGMGALAPYLTWGALLGMPAVGIGGALFTRGMLGDLFQGVAAGGTAILGYSLPAMLVPAAGRKTPLTQEQLALIAASGGVKLLGAGPAAAAMAAAKAAGVRSSVEF